MERIEIVEGLKQAIERGESLEEAKLSFINAGYDPKDVEDSAKKLQEGALTISTPSSLLQSERIPKTMLNKNNITPLETIKQKPPQIKDNLKALPIMQAVKPQQKNQHKKPKAMFFLLFIIIILLGILLFLFLAKDKAVKLLENLFK